MGGGASAERRARVQEAHPAELFKILQDISKDACEEDIHEGHKELLLKALERTHEENENRPAAVESAAPSRPPDSEAKASGSSKQETKCAGDVDLQTEDLRQKLEATQEELFRLKEEMWSQQKQHEEELRKLREEFQGKVAEELPKPDQAPEAASKDTAEVSQTATLEDAETLEADKAAAEECKGSVHKAAGKSAAALRHLLRQNPERLEENVHGERPLHFAAAFGRTSAVELLLARGAELEAKDRLGSTPLALAAAGGHLSVVERLIVAGAALDATDNDGETPLHAAARRGHLSVVERLIVAGAAVDAVGKYGHTPYDVATGEDVKSRLDTVFVVSVALLSGRDCSCKLSKNKSISDLKKTAGRELEIEIQRLVNSDGETLNEFDSLRKANVKAGDRLMAVN